MDVGKTVERARVGDWMITHSGKRFWPMDPRPEDIDLRDIAHALSLVCRYGGHVRRFFSVAEHSVLLAKYFLRRGDWTWARVSLLHDCDEAYIGDMVRPLKSSMPLFAAAGGLIQGVVFDLVGLDPGIPHEVHVADSLIIGNEARALFREEALAAADWVPPEGLPGVEIVGHPPHVAEREFVRLLGELFGDLAAR